jgi:hypothetical protein
MALDDETIRTALMQIIGELRAIHELLEQQAKS